MVNFWNSLPTPFTVLAPMDDVTDNVFRKVIQETARPDVFFTEFTNTDGLTSVGARVVSRKLKFEIKQRPVVAQIWGNKVESFFKAAQIIKELGFDGIDINMGCPVREIVKKCAGAGLIGQNSLAKEIIEAVKKGAPGVPLSVKTRLGITKNVGEEWATFLLEQELCALTIHGRTAIQMSKVPADWDEIGKVVNIKNRVAPKTLVIGNGDIKSWGQITNMHNKYGVDGVMIGRGIFDNPWVFSKNIALHKKEEYVNLLLKHFDYFEAENTSAEVQKKRYPALKKFFKMYIKDFDGASIFRQKLMEMENLQKARAELLKLLLGWRE
jgi:tRNA-dihydrouridine synthase